MTIIAYALIRTSHLPSTHRLRQEVFIHILSDLSCETGGGNKVVHGGFVSRSP